MGNISDKLTYLKNTKTAIKNSINEHGGSVTDSDTFRSYANKIASLDPYYDEPVEDWKPDPLWWDIEKILAEDTETQDDGTEYAAKAIVLINANYGNSVYMKGANKYKTSEGTIVNGDKGSGMNVSFTGSNDKMSSGGYKTRYIICYFNNNIISSQYLELCNYGALYIILDGLIIDYNGSNNIGGYNMLKAFKFKNGAKSTSVSMLFTNCHLLEYIEMFDTSEITDFSQCFYDCYNLKKIEGNFVYNQATKADNIFNCMNKKSMEFNLPNVTESLYLILNGATKKVKINSTFKSLKVDSGYSTHGGALEYLEIEGNFNKNGILNLLSSVSRPFPLKFLKINCANDTSINLSLKTDIMQHTLETVENANQNTKIIITGFDKLPALKGIKGNYLLSATTASTRFTFSNNYNLTRETLLDIMNHLDNWSGTSSNAPIFILGNRKFEFSEQELQKITGKRWTIQ